MLLAHMTQVKNGGPMLRVAPASAFHRTADRRAGFSGIRPILEVTE
jgi:hypothetical protein